LLEVEVEERLGEGVEHLGGRADVDDGVDVVGRALGMLTTLGAVEVDQLPAHERPAGRDLLVEVHQTVPRGGLPG
jgi:hypothetical protein